MTVFHVDLDNTLIFSYKRDIGREKRCVEVYQGREISFITEKTYGLLQKVKQKVLLVPTTTRTQEQYKRISLGVGELPYALVCNGGVLLINGKKDEKWYAHSLELAAASSREMKKAIAFLEKVPERELEVRFIDGLFVFTKCRKPETVVRTLREELDIGSVDVLCNGLKVYVVPKELSKGRAVQRFREYKKDALVLAAGDSGFDITMLEAADRAAAPRSLMEDTVFSGHVSCMPGNAVYSEEILGYVLNMF